MSARILLLCCLLLLVSLHCSNVASQSEETKKNKFREREATDDALGYPNADEDDLLNTQCPQHLELRWQTEVSSSIYASPLIADINSDGKLEVVVPSFVHYLEVLEGSDGDKMPGWPAFHQSTVHSSPLLYDIDKDGVREIALATYNGEVLFFRVSGYMMSDKLVIPRMKVKKDWHVGLNPDPVDRSHPDVHDDSLVQEALVESMKHLNASTAGLNTSHATSANVPHETVNASTGTAAEGSGSIASNVDRQVNETRSEGDAHIEMPRSTNNASLGSTAEDVGDALNGTKSGRRLLQDNVSKTSEENNSGSSTVNGVGQAATVENAEGLEAEADSSFELFRDSDELADEYNYDYDDYVDPEMWGDEEWTEAKHEELENYVEIDAHILCTPVSGSHITASGIQPPISLD